VGDYRTRRARGKESVKDPPVRATGQVSEDPLPNGQPSSEDLQEAGRTICLRFVGPGDKVLARVDMVLMGPTEPLKVPLTLGVEGGGEGWIAEEAFLHQGTDFCCILKG